jgi:hypothetical protein
METKSESDTRRLVLSYVWGRHLDRRNQDGVPGRQRPSKLVDSVMSIAHDIAQWAVRQHEKRYHGHERTTDN